MRLFSDLFALTVALTMATATRFGRDAIQSQGAYGRYVWLFLILWMVSMGVTGAYSRHAVDDATEEFRTVLSGSALGVTVAVTGSFIVNFELSRMWLAYAFMFGVGFTLFGRGLVRLFQKWQRSRGMLERRVLVVGTDASALDLADYAERVSGSASLVIAGFVSVPGHRSSIDPNRIVGSVDELADLVEFYGAVEVLVSPSIGVGAGFEDVVASLDGVRVELLAAPGALGFLPSRITVQSLGDRPMLHLERSELLPWAKAVKRVMDLVLGIPLILLTLPLIMLCAIAIRLDSRGPAFFRQPRAGNDAAAFKIWKLRTMVVDAEAQRKAVIAATEGDVRLFKSAIDPRVTRVGRFLRKSSLDELPQLFNVVSGQMSLVGPRPPIFEEVDGYSSTVRRRLHVKPGMTGLWQVKGRHELSFDDYIEQDLLYVQNWSLALDLAILFRTIPAVLRMKGAS